MTGLLVLTTGSNRPKAAFGGPLLVVQTAKLDDCFLAAAVGVYTPLAARREVMKRTFRPNSNETMRDGAAGYPLE